MIGAIYQNQIRQLITEVSSTWVDLKTSFDFLYEAAKDFAKETRACHDSQTITTVANQSEYHLKPNFLEIMTRDDHDKNTVKFYDGTNTDWLTTESYSDLLQNNNDPGTPTDFAITDEAIIDRITGTATSNGSATGGESTLSDSSGDFSSVAVGDYVMNTTAGHYGYILSTGTTSLTTAIFDISTVGGAYGYWTSGDAYLIQPAPRYKIVLDPAPDTSGYTITVPYFAKPNPVYSDYGLYPFATGYEEALIKYAVWLYKYRDGKPGHGDPLFMAYEKAMRKAKNVNRKAVGTLGFRINFMK